ncbi:hypothetical protein XH96_07900 [Bradyrhizobium sp. CCBAU 51765]|nr:hypothetical protein XH96_07900 [Bradyrhizobium sp. CCBAU 51765]
MDGFHSNTPWSHALEGVPQILDPCGGRMQARRMPPSCGRLDRCNERGALPLPLAGEGWGEGVSAMGQSLREESPHPRRSLSSGAPSARPGGRDLSRKRES